MLQMLEINQNEFEKNKDIPQRRMASSHCVKSRIELPVFFPFCSKYEWFELIRFQFRLFMRLFLPFPWWVE